MERWKRIRSTWFDQPTIWLLRSFFQPAGFKIDFDTHKLSTRLSVMIRLLLPMFVFAFPLALFIRTSLLVLNSDLYSHYSIHGNIMLDPMTRLFIWDALWSALASCVVVGLMGGFFSIPYGIALGIASTLANSIVIYISSAIAADIIYGLSFGLLLGLTFNNIGSIRRSGLMQTTAGIISGIFVGMLFGVIFGTLGSYWSGLLVGLLGGPALHRSDSVWGSTIGFIGGGFCAMIVMNVGSILVRGSLLRAGHARYIEMVNVATQLGIMVAGAFGSAIGIQVGDAGMSGLSLLAGINAGWLGGIIIGIFFLLSYIPSYYRLPLYPLSSLAMIRTYFNCQKAPLRVLFYLRRSALHCDECVFLPLPYVKQMLLLAAEQDKEETLEEIDFIIHERPQQRGAAQAAVLEMALFDLHMRESLRDISRAHQRLLVTLPQEIRLLDPMLARLLSCLEDASRDAASYYLRMDGRARQDALESILGNLKKIHPATTFRDATLNRRLEEIVQKWQAITRHELDNIANGPENFGHIDNPYTPGLALELHKPLFVGREDVAQQLSEALSRSRRPTFFLTGERRMGKSSILKQLPGLLGSQYLSVFYDLQSTGVASSVAALLAAIAEGIYEQLSAKGMLVKRLEYEQLREDQRENEAVAYHRFDRWIRDVEQILERENRILLLAFDEFEKLEEADQRGHIDLKALLDWFRSVIQNRPRLALLFSGVKTMSEMGQNWAGYFVNVETLKVSFLRLAEARQLIVHPTPEFPGEHVFNEEVIGEIIRVTGCHPFLLQALCSIIVSNLNATQREQATCRDVEIAQDEVFKKWGDNYFKDLWERTDAEQRLCLFAIQSLQKATSTQIQQQSGLDEATTRRTLQRLLKRDILLCNDETYRLAAPIFSEWISHNL
ncbi:MAG: AAA family ATPase [Ktedonobacteraceae bacterium]|nr:AAA family ATPase [Ktedonobacteraceae bacterium]